MSTGALRQRERNLRLNFRPHGLDFEMKALAILETCRGTKDPAHEGERSDGRKGAGSEQQQGPNIHETYIRHAHFSLKPNQRLRCFLTIN